MSLAERSARSKESPTAVRLRNGTFSVDDRDMKRLEALAKAKGGTVSGLLREAVADYLAHQVGDLSQLDLQMAEIHEAEVRLHQLYAGIRTKQQ